jgi:cyclophilin family peptidyl-prolyl cis-trans isomerase
MATVGVNTNGSQFYISFKETPYLNGLCPVFGRVTNTDDLLARLEKVIIIFDSFQSAVSCFFSL